MEYIWPQNDDILTSTTMVIFATATCWLFFAKGISTNETIDKNADGKSSKIPDAPGGIPVLGHALSYKKDPPGFLLRMVRECGPVFRLNLAGKKMIIVCGAEQQRQLASLPESVLSLRKAVGAIGFEQMLGHKNVHEGTQIHKGIVKGIWNNKSKTGGASNNATSSLDRQLITWQTGIRESMETELMVSGDNGGGKNKVDFLKLVRRVTLRAVIDIFIGKAFLKDWTSCDFLKDFMDFQDTLEDVTAKSVLLPKWLALVAMLWPLQRRRERLQLVIQERLESAMVQKKPNGGGSGSNNDDGAFGFWLHQVSAQGIPVSEISEYIVGLLFAAHKNPAIGSAQTFILLREHASEEVRARCQKEAAELISSSTPIGWSRYSSSLPTLRRSCLESLRVTAHTIGGVRTAQKDLNVLVKEDIDGKETLYHIPNDSSVGFAHITSSLDTSVWGKDAGVFDSDLSRHSEESYTDDYKFTTFSHGVHKCPGREFAMIHLQTTVALLLVEYNVELPEKIPSLDFERATLAQRESAVMVSIKRR